MRLCIKEEYVGSRPIPSVALRMQNKLNVTTQMFPNNEEFESKFQEAIDITDSDTEAVFQDNAMTMVKLRAGNYIAEYYCLRHEGWLLFYNVGMVLFKCKER